jgi:hypothetical protein
LEESIKHVLAERVSDGYINKVKKIPPPAEINIIY